MASPALAVRDLSYLVFAICGAIFVIVGGLLAYAVIRFRRRPQRDCAGRVGTGLLPQLLVPIRPGCDAAPVVA